MTQELFECRRSQGLMDARFTLKGSEPHYAPDRSFDTEHIRLDVTVDLAAKSLAGLCTTSLRAVAEGASTMVFDAVGFQVRRVLLNGRPAQYNYDGKKLTVTFPKPATAGTAATVAVDYKVVRPKLGLYFVGPDKGEPSKPLQAWTQGEDEYARYWFPCHDAPHDRTTTEMVARVPKGFTAVSNGKLVRRGASGRHALFHWKQEIPHATYLVTLAVGRFVEMKDVWRGVPVQYYVPAGREDDARRAFGKTPAMMEFFSSKIGVRYPYAKYAQVAAADFIFGGMENTSATTQTALTLHDERAHLDFSSDPLVAHELAHQWFGDLLTCRDWSHAWLNESFATYFEALFTEFDKGADEFAYELNQNASFYFDEDRDHYRRPIVTKVFKQPSDLFDRHLYEKGSRVLHMLRYLLGDRDFWRSIHTYVADNRERTVQTGDLLDAIQKATGRNLGRFFDQWVFSGGHPEFKIRTWWDAKRKEVNVRLVQTQNVNGETALFHLPVEFLFETAQGEKRFKETVDKRSHLFTFPLPSEPILFLFDPDAWLLKKVDVVKSEALWIRQLSAARHPEARVEAARALAKIGGPGATAALARALREENFWWVQGEVAQALGGIRSVAAGRALAEAYQRLTHPKARRMLLAALGEMRDPLFLSDLRAGVASEKSYSAANQALRSLAKFGDEAALPLIEKALASDSWNQTLRVGALESLTLLRPAGLIDRLLAYTRSHQPSPVRMAAVRCLAQVGAGRNEVQDALIKLAEDPYLLLQMTAVRGLEQIGDERAVPVLKRLTEGDRDGRLKRTAEEVMEKIRKHIETEGKKGGGKG